MKRQHTMPAYLHGALILWAICLPVDIRLGMLPGGWGEKARMTDLVFLIFAAAWLNALIRSRRRVNIPQGWYYPLFLLVTGAVSVFAAGDKGKALVQLAAFGYLIFIFWIIYDITRTYPDAFNRFSHGYVSTFQWVALATLVAFFLSWKFGISTPLAKSFSTYANLSHFPRVQGLSHNPNAFAFDLMFAIFLAIPLTLQNLKAGTGIGKKWVGIFLMITVFFLTLSRLIVGLAFGIWVLCKILPPQLSFLKWLRKITAGFLILAVPAIIIATVWTILPVKVDYQKSGVDRELSIQWNSSWNMYFELNRAGLEMLNDRPLTGVGLGNFRVLIGEYLDRHPMDPYGIYSTPETRRHFSPHNAYLGWISQTGATGVLSLVLFLGWLVKNCRPRQSPTPLELSFWALLLGVLVNGCLNDFLFARMFWVFAGFALASRTLIHEGRSSKIPTL